MKLYKKLVSHPDVQTADALISMIPQTDMMLALMRPWRKQIRVAFVRGAAWPQKGEANEAKRLLWRFLERCALGRMDEVWSTTTVLRDDIAWPSAVIVPAGIADVGLQNEHNVVASNTNIVWAARMSVDKNPQLFLNVLRDLELPGRMYGDGEMRADLETMAPQNVTFGGWVDPLTLWNGAGIYLGTSFREAFGRSAVEAATYGIPMVLSKAFGAAPLLFTDPELRDRFVLDPVDSAGWVQATGDLANDQELRQKVASHVWTNAKKLTIEGSLNAVCARLAAVAARKRPIDAK
ncbi:glycosyltransferase [Arthrobacter alpinus]|uniref:glycosyltransferase n=1 Tax=Arthrobacter alpinus TaxID=656366 RepID=UPI00147C483D|nr:glycosyltransferase [Arthrobacter alpinus]